jgi:hypothetical protein
MNFFEKMVKVLLMRDEVWHEHDNRRYKSGRGSSSRSHRRTSRALMTRNRRRRSNRRAISEGMTDI